MLPEEQRSEGQTKIRGELSNSQCNSEALQFANSHKTHMMTRVSQSLMRKVKICKVNF